MKITAREIELKNGKRCILRSPGLEDGEALIDYLKDTAAETPYLIRYPEEVSMTPEREREYLQSVLDAERSVMIVAEVDGELAGNCAFSALGNFSRFRHRCEVAIALRKKYWSLGRT